MTFARTFFGAALTALVLSTPALAGDGVLGVYLTEDTGGRKGALIEEVAANSAAAQADLRKGDRIVKCNGQETPHGAALIRHLKKGNAGDTLELRVNREGWEKTIRVRLAPRADAAPANKKPTRTAPAKERGFLGIYLRQNEKGLPVVDGVMDNSPAAAAGLKVGDTITSVGGSSVADPSALITAVSQFGVGDTLEFRVMRRDKAQAITVTLGRRPAEGSAPPPPAAAAKPEPAPSPSAKKRPYIGIALVDAEGKGPLRVDDVQAGSPAERFGLRPQDVIISANGKSLKTIEDFVQLMGSLHAGDAVLFKIERDGWKSDVRLTLGASK